MDVLDSALDTIGESRTLLSGLLLVFAALLAISALARRGRIPGRAGASGDAEYTVVETSPPPPPPDPRLPIALVLVLLALFIYLPAGTEAPPETGPGATGPPLADPLAAGRVDEKDRRPLADPPPSRPPAARQTASPDPPSADTLVARARDRMHVGAFAEAFRLFDAARNRLSGGERVDPALAREAKAAYARGEYQTAARLYDSAFQGVTPR